MQIDLSPWFAQPGAQAFTERRAAMPWRNTVPLPADAVQPAWHQLLLNPAPPRKRLVYLHIPFCATRCTFCGFYQHKFQPDEADRYVNALLREIEMEADSPLYQSAPVHAVYFGGGTPTALSAAGLYRLISLLKARLPLAPDCEITIEGRTLNVDDARIDACLDAGANRFSIGIQTFDSRIRQRMGRTADRQQSIAFLKKLCRRDRAAVVCDLIFGLPGQTASLWRQDLATIRDIGLDGVDLYALNLLPTTPLAKAADNERVMLPDVAARHAFYLQGAGLLEEYGWRQLSNSHWAGTTRERNLYNLLIKQGADCLASGCGAGGSVNGQAYMIERKLDSYYQALARGHKPVSMMTQAAGGTHQWRHQLQAGIETGRVDLKLLTARAALLQPLVDQWHHSGLLTTNDLCLRFTGSGRFWANNIMQCLTEILLRLSTVSGEGSEHG